MSTLSEVGKHTMCSYHIRNEKMLAISYLTSERKQRAIGI